MDILTDPAFWGEVGLAAASRLALLAAVVWIARMAVNRQVPSNPAILHATDDTAAAPRNRLNAAMPPGEPAFVNLKLRPASALPGGQHSATHDRLMQYVQRRAMERTTS